MPPLLSTYLFVSRKLTPELLGQVAEAGFGGIEVFCTRGHFDYHSREEILELARVLTDHKLVLASLHAPTSRDLGPTREGGAPLSLCEIERVRRVEAMDEFKRAIDVAQDLPFPRIVMHMGGSRETSDPRKRDAAFSSLEHLTLHAKHAGVTIALENTMSEMGDPAYLRAFVEETRLSALRFCFDVGHAYLMEGAAEERIANAFEAIGDLVATVHLHDNRGEKDEHLLPFAGDIGWEAAAKLLVAAPANPLPLILELKEQTGPEAPGTAAQLEAARCASERMEELIQKVKRQASR